MVFKLDEYYIKIHKCDSGYDYSIYDYDYELIDGGVYENLEYKIYDVLKDIIIDNRLFIDNKDIKIVDYKEFDEIIEEKEMLKFNILSIRNSTT
ncbi:MAG: LPD16 domain-containing protein [Peptostreptococcaceae bacterium]